MLNYVIYARQIATPQQIEEEWRGYWLILDEDEFVCEDRTPCTFSCKENAIESAESLCACWKEDYDLAQANAA